MVTVMSPARLRTTVAACTVAVGLIVWQVVAWGPLSDLDVSAAAEARRIRPNRDFFEITVMFGLRGIILTVCLPYLAWRWWKDRLWWPVTGFVTVLLLETGMLGAVKVAVGRSFPYQGDMVLEAGFLAFPSGHAGNVVALWGFCAWYFSNRRPGLRPLMWTIVVLFTVTVGVSSWLIRTHWPTDLFAGYALGALALVTVVSVLRAVDVSRQANVQPVRATLP